jgi:hypothetical protein
MLVSAARGRRKEQMEAKRKLCNENGGISLAGGSQAQKCIPLYEFRFSNTSKERENNLARKIRQDGK